MQAWKRGLRKETSGLPRHLRMKNGMPLLPAALKECDFLMTLVISSSEIDIGEGTSTGYESLRVSVRPASGIVKKKQDFRELAFSEGDEATLVVVTKLGMVGGVGGRWLHSFAHFANGEMPLLPLAASATACLKCAALALVIADPLALSASW
jgi:hypothetical protein